MKLDVVETLELVGGTLYDWTLLPIAPLLKEPLRDEPPGSGLQSTRFMSVFESGVWNSDGLVTHSCRTFCSRRTCNGFDAMPTSAMISRNSSSPASHSCWTSSPPEMVLVSLLYCDIDVKRKSYPSPEGCHSRRGGSLFGELCTTEARLRLKDSM